MKKDSYRILYLMTVPWGWIKQRPHFLAEKLANDQKVDVFYKVPLKVSKKDLLTEKPANSNLNIKHFFILPFEKIPLLKYLNLSFINRVLCFLYIRRINKYDIIWFASPVLFPLFSHRIRNNQMVVYDCMDDMVEFGNDDDNFREKAFILNSEKELLKRANAVFCSAEYLKNKVLSRAGLQQKRAIVVNNAIEIPNTDRELQMPSNILSLLNKIKNINNTLLYIGTISEWFDFESVLYALDNNKELTVTLIGPTQVPLPNHERLYYFGTIERQYLFQFMKYAKALIMPFVVNELIRSVNPVKLYEYIYSGRPVIASRYGETEVFSEYVHLYSDKYEFYNLVSLLDSEKIDIAYINRCKEFVSNNTWENRCDQIIEELLACYE